MGSDEDRSTNLTTRSHLASCSRSCGLTGSIVPATGPAPGDWCLVVARIRDLSSLYGGRGLLGHKRCPVSQHPVQDDSKLARERHLRLPHAGALGHAHRPTLQ
jgi:hypothetical protein